MQGVRAVLFDAVGTLIRVAPSVAEIYRGVGLRYGANVEQDEIGRRFAEAMRRENERDEWEWGHCTSEEREFERWKAIVASIFADSPRQTEIFAELWDTFGRAETWAAYDDVAPTLEVLAKRGFVLGVASNFDRRLRAVMAGLPALANVTHCFVSSELGHRKPSRRFFEAIQAELDLPLEAILLAGDDYENDFLAARECGWRAVHLDRTATRHGEEVVAGLRELLMRIGD
jgi:putative hydrolase of the HAD superfamily